MMMPWLLWFLVGFVDIVRTRPRRVVAEMWLLVYWLVLPIFVMTFFAERRDRYLLPMAGPAALIAAYGLLRHLPKWRAKWNPAQSILITVQIIGLAVMAIALPIWGGISLRLAVPARMQMATVDATPWYTPGFVAFAVVCALGLFVCMFLAYRQSRAGFVAGSVALMLLANAVFLWGYKDSLNGRSEGKLLADDIEEPYPDALLFNAAPQHRPMLPLELLIYLNRDVPGITDASKLGASDRPQVLIYPPNGDDSLAIPMPPEGFRFLAAQKINTGMYYAFVRDTR
ncbi:MAG TPA: hypothetical protein VL992_05405, partial [Tepidisphaeraceae bacterium]|nr:hypothetical protein [Tepidisphaeraceae bacterium]